MGRDRVASRAPDELLDARLRIVDCAERLYELGGIADPPDSPDRDLDLLAIGGGNVDKLLVLTGPVPDLKRLGQPQHFPG